MGDLAVELCVVNWQRKATLADVVYNANDLRFPPFFGEMAIIYSAIMPDGRRYIGKTTRVLEKRKKEHFYDAFRRGLEGPLHDAIRACEDIDEIRWEILFECPVEVASKAVSRHVDHYDTLTPNGLNKPSEFSWMSPHSLYPLDEWKSALEKEIDRQASFTAEAQLFKASKLDWKYHFSPYEDGYWLSETPKGCAIFSEYELAVDMYGIDIGTTDNLTGIEISRRAIAKAESILL